MNLMNLSSATRELRMKIQDAYGIRFVDTIFNLNTGVSAKMYAFII